MGYNAADKRRIAEGICIRCKEKPVAEGLRRCEECRETVNWKMRVRYLQKCRERHKAKGAG